MAAAGKPGIIPGWLERRGLREDWRSTRSLSAQKLSAVRSILSPSMRKRLPEHQSLGCTRSTSVARAECNRRHTLDSPRRDYDGKLASPSSDGERIDIPAVEFWRSAGRSHSIIRYARHIGMVEACNEILSFRRRLAVFVILSPEDATCFPELLPPA